jgi:hypothetical protein
MRTTVVRLRFVFVHCRARFDRFRSDLVLPKQRLDRSLNDRVAPYTDLKGMVEAVLNEIVNQDPKIQRQGYGGLVHVNNHAAPITDLA